MRFLAIFPFLCAVVAFTLTMLCIFAGSRTGYLENLDVLTVNTSMLGIYAFNTSTSSGGGFFSNLRGQIEGELEGELNGFIEDIAKDLNIHDFYSMHLLDYCEGYYTPSPVTNATSNPTKNVTSCSNHTGLFTFDPTAILQSELKSGVNLSDLHWPSEVEDAIVALEVATKAMFVCYCIGVAFAGLAIIGAVIAFFTNGRLGDAVNFMLDFLAFLALCISSGIVTAFMVKLTNTINDYSDDTGVSASKGTQFLILTWVSTGLMLLASIIWLIDCCVGGSRRRQSRRVGHEKGVN